MQITNVKIRRLYQDQRLKALVSVTLDGVLAIHDIKVIQGPERLFVAMPSRRDENGIYRDIAHPISPQARRELEDAVLSCYKNYISGQQLQNGARELETTVGAPDIPAARSTIYH